LLGRHGCLLSTTISLSLIHGTDVPYLFEESSTGGLDTRRT
jgi:hypothetical protein